MKSPLPLILLLTFLVSCTSPEERAIEATLTFAGANRTELEKVLHHYKDEPLKQAAARFLIAHMTDGEGNATALVPDVTQEETVTLTRKHPLTKYRVTLMHDMDGVRIYGSNDKDFHHRTLLGEPMCDSLCNRKKEITPENAGTFRYVMVCPPEGKRLNVSELEVYEEGKKVECRIVRADAPLGGVTDYSKEKALDGDNLSRFEALNVGTDFVVELERPVRIDHIVYVSRNDDNYVAPGETYELFYQNGEEGWKSLGMQTATEELLVYENVPRGALLWLHNHTRGVEEQVFRWLDGEQVFCYRL